MLATRTFLFSDLRDYTTFVERHGDSAAAALIADYRRIVRAELARHEGGEVKTEGDSFYVVFSTTGAAVTCAAAILRAADRYSRERPDRPMRIGVGIHAGEPVPHEGQFVGSAVIVAARLAQTAKAGELLVTDVVRALLPRALSLPMEERTGLALKGIEDPPRVFSVDWRAVAPARPESARTTGTTIAAAAPVSQQVLCPVVIGRARELAALEDQLVAAIAGRGRMTLVSGEAGLGKSALMRRFVERVRAHGARLLLGDCTEIEARRPFGPFIDAFVSGDLPLPAELAQGGPGALPVAELERYRVHGAFADRLADAARERPVVLIVEDLHWGDEATFELVPYLARKLRDDRVLLVATYRSDELHRLHPLNHVLAELARGRLADDVRLGRLTLEEVGEVIRAALALAQPPTREFRQALFDRTEGNPFFVEEILRALVERGELEYREGAWHRTKAVAELTIPASVRDAVQQRLLGLEPRARKAMHVAAVIGQRFDFELLSAVSGLDEAALLDAIKAAIDAQLVREEADAEGTEVYAFRHALSREAVLTELLQRERRLLHRSVGEAIERAAGAHPEPRAEELAYHFDEARDAPRAFRYHQLAAERSLRMGAPRPAMQHLERAIELAPDDDPALVTLSLRLADVATSVADNARALRAAEQARSIAEQRGDTLAAGEAIHRLAMFRWFLGDAKRAEQIALEGVTLLEPLGDSAALAACYNELSRLAMIDGRTDDSVRWGERASAMARETGAIQVEVFALNFMGTALTKDPARAEAGLAMLRRSLALAEERGLPYHAQRAYNNLLASLARTGASFGERRRLHDESIEHARRHGLRIDPLIFREALYAYVDGDWDRALAIIDEARSDTTFSASRDHLKAQILVARDGPAGDALQLSELATARLSAGDAQTKLSATASATVHFIAGDHRRAIDAAGPAREGFATSGIADLSRMVATLALRSASLVEDGTALMQWMDTIRDAGPTRAAGAFQYAIGLAARREGRAADAIGALEEAATIFDEQASPVARVAARQEEIETLVELGRTDEAARVFAQLTPYWRKAGATWYVAQLEAWARERGLAVEA